MRKHLSIKPGDGLKGRNCVGYFDIKEVDVISTNRSTTIEVIGSAQNVLMGCANVEQQLDSNMLTDEGRKQRLRIIGTSDQIIDLCAEIINAVGTEKL